MNSDDVLVSLSNKDIKFCLGCNACANKLGRYCVLDDYISNSVYDKIKSSENIVFASPLYMSHITGLLKNLIDRLNPFYHHDYLNGKKIYLILTGGGSYIDNKEEIDDIIKYFSGISEWLNFEFSFLGYFTSGNSDDVKKEEKDYLKNIERIKGELNQSIE